MCKQNLLNAGQNAIEAELTANGFNKTATLYGFASGGSLRNAVASLGWYGLEKPESRSAEGRAKADSDGAEKPAARPRKSKGCLPKRVEGWVINQLGRAWESEGNEPDDYIPAPVTSEVVETIIIGDNANWNGLVRKLGDEEIEALEAWLGDYATMTRRHELGIAKKRDKIREKASALLIKALKVADAGDSELSIAISRLLEEFGISESESE